MKKDLELTAFIPNQYTFHVTWEVLLHRLEHGANKPAAAKYIRENVLVQVFACNLLGRSSKKFPNIPQQPANSRWIPILRNAHQAR